MPARISILQLGRILFSPNAVFQAVANESPPAGRVFFRIALWLGLLPPLFAYFGTLKFGGRLGFEPVYLPRSTVPAICAVYFGALLVGFLSSAIIARWMAATYDASRPRPLPRDGDVGAPLAVGSVIHCTRTLSDVPCSCRFSSGTLPPVSRPPIVLATGPNRGMLMASALIAYLLVALVSLLGLTVALWGRGIGPSIGT
jgi:hypothetical protein